MPFRGVGSIEGIQKSLLKRKMDSKRWMTAQNDSTNRYTGWSDLWPPCYICFRKNDWQRNGDFASPYQYNCYFEVDQVKVRKVNPMHLRAIIDWIAVNLRHHRNCWIMWLPLSRLSWAWAWWLISAVPSDTACWERDEAAPKPRYLIDQERRAKIAPSSVPSTVLTLNKNVMKKNGLHCCPILLPLEIALLMV